MGDGAETPIEVRLKAEAHARGFALAGIAAATDADTFPHFATWLDQGLAGTMDYLHRHREERRHPKSVLEAVRSVLMVGMEYAVSERSEWGDDSHRAQSLTDSGSVVRSLRERSLAESAGPNAVFPSLTVSDHQPPFTGRVAAYAQGPEYHRFIWDRLNDLSDWLESTVPGCAAEAVADTAPLLERDFARRAGLGWVGKNTMLIHPARGSFFFLGALLTDLALAPDRPFTTSHCGTCTACLDACPTAAFPRPQVLDARKCISYLTIELRAPIPEPLRQPMGNWLYGCDICQDVCPWNRKAATRTVPFPRDPGLEALDPVELLGLGPDAFRARFKHTSLWRNRRTGLLRNAAIVLGNIGDERALPALERSLADPDEVIREAAAWAIGQIRERAARRG